MNAPLFRQLFDYETWTYTYLLADRETGEAVLIDTVKEQAERDLSLLADLGLKLVLVLDTHIHADHVTAAALLRQRTGAKTAVSAAAKVKCADLLLEDGQELTYGRFRLRAIATPGHTDSCMSFYSEGMVFTGDTLMVRDVGRTDFQQGSPEKMYESITAKLFALPPDTRVFPAHDYLGRTMTTIAEERALNSKVGGNKSLGQFRELMAAMKLGQPKRIHVAVPANLECGGL